MLLIYKEDTMLANRNSQGDNVLSHPLQPAFAATVIIALVQFGSDEDNVLSWNYKEKMNYGCTHAWKKELNQVATWMYA